MTGNWQSFLSFNAASPDAPYSNNPVNSIKVSRDGAKKHGGKRHFHALNQAEDITLIFEYTVDREAIAEALKASFFVYNLERTKVLSYTIDDNVSFGSGIFTVQLKDNETAGMLGKYWYELWMKDSAGNDTLMFEGALKFKPTSGRIV